VGGGSGFIYESEVVTTQGYSVPYLDLDQGPMRNTAHYGNFHIRRIEGIKTTVTNTAVTRFARMEQLQQRTLIAVIGDEDTVTGMLLAGVGQVDAQQNKNFMIVDNKITPSDVQAKFQELTSRDDVAILLINQHVADMIRIHVDEYEQPFPTVLEIPSKDHPYDPSRDSVLKRVQRLFGD